MAPSSPPGQYFLLAPQHVDDPKGQQCGAISEQANAVLGLVLFLGDTFLTLIGIWNKNIINNTVVQDSGKVSPSENASFYVQQDEFGTEEMQKGTHWIDYQQFSVLSATNCMSKFSPTFIAFHSHRNVWKVKTTNLVI